MAETIGNTAAIFKALGEETRLKIIKIIAARGNSLCVGAIAKQLDVSQPAVSQHLKILKNAGLVKADREGFRVHYSFVGDSLKACGIDVNAFLASFCAAPEPDSGTCGLRGE